MIMYTDVLSFSKIIFKKINFLKLSQTLNYNIIVKYNNHKKGSEQCETKLS